jgi:hypothetical protein
MVVGFWSGSISESAIVARSHLSVSIRTAVRLFMLSLAWAPRHKANIYLYHKTNKTKKKCCVNSAHLVPKQDNSIEPNKQIV